MGGEQRFSLGQIRKAQGLTPQKRFLNGKTDRIYIYIYAVVLTISLEIIIDMHLPRHQQFSEHPTKLDQL